MPSKPNIVFMLADNVGWGDLSSYGGLVPTPRLDELAAQGMRFTNFNTEAQCTPTRTRRSTKMEAIGAKSSVNPARIAGLTLLLAPTASICVLLLVRIGVHCA